MKKIILIFILFSGLGNLISAQYFIQIAKTDSTKIIHRKEKFKCPDKSDTIKNYFVEPLHYYCFYSSFTSTILNLDSSKKEYARTEATYYFDDSSYFIAYKSITTYRDDEFVPDCQYSLDEIKDSLRYTFKSCRNDVVKKFDFINLNKCDLDTLKIDYNANSIFNAYIKTGKTKKIQGYLCSEYIKNDSLYKTTIWAISPNDNWLKKVKSDMEHTTQPLSFKDSEIQLEVEFYSKKNKTYHSFKIKKINRNIFYRITTENGSLKF